MEIAAAGPRAPATAEDAAVTILRDAGNGLFKEQRFLEAAGLYRKALALLRPLPLPLGKEAVAVTPKPGSRGHGNGSAGQTLAHALRLNLALCLQRAGGDLGEALQLCDEVLAVDPASAKALFRRGAVRRGLAEEGGPPGRGAVAATERREALQLARMDLLAAARAEPQDRHVRALLEEATQALLRLPAVDDAGAAAAPAAAGLLPRLAKGGGLYCDRQAPPPPPPPLECPNCARTGHGGCGKTWWVAQRARWLGLPQEVVAWEPATFEEEGTLAVSGRRAAGPGAGAPGEGRCGGGGSVSDGGAGAAAAASAATVPSTRAAPVLADLSELSDEEIEALRACIDATERPFPQLKRQLPLAHAVQCAEELWEECG